MGNNKTWQYLTLFFFITTVIAGIVAAVNISKEPQTKEVVKETQNQQTPEQNTPVDDDSLALKDFNLDIGGLVNAAGFGSGSILAVKTNSEGTYMVGEVKSGETYGYAYRVIPDGAWTKTALSKDGENDCHSTVSKEELEAFADVELSNGTVYCTADTGGYDEETQTTTSAASRFTAAEALKASAYTSNN